ncbi:DUF2388 domain-containing protein [Pseudomonas sp. B392_1p]|uniref:DUF2388 domain-containing protein n=1 Tax=Pseudomonas sp. B392_1p TaxID=3457507 RepID=UPI003FD4572E
MRRTLLMFSAIALGVSATSLSARDWSDYATSAGISASLYSTLKDDKVVSAAQDDASAFVASGGTLRGAYLDAALQQVREQYPDLQVNDLELATAILAYPQHFAE